MRLPAAAPGASTPARPSAGTGGARPRSDWIYHPCPAPPTPLAARRRWVPRCRGAAAAEASALRRGQGCESGVWDLASCSLLLSLASLPRDVQEVRPQGDAPVSCSSSLMEKVCAQLNPGRLLSRKMEAFSTSPPPPPGERLKSTFLCSEVKAGTGPLVRAPRLRTEAQPLPKRSARSYGNDPFYSKAVGT